MTVRVLLTSTGGAMSPYTIERFRAGQRYRVEVVAVDASDAALGRHFADRFERVPPGSAPDYVDRIVEICERHSVDLVLPCSDEEAIALSAARARVERDGRVLACPPHAAIEIMSDKLATLEFLDRIGVPAPVWRVARSDAELAAAIAELRERFATVAVKPVRSRGSRGVFVIERDRAGIHQPAGHREVYLDLASFKSGGFVSASAAAPVLVTEGLRAPAHDTDVLAWRGEVRRALPRLRVNPAGIPFRGGVMLDDPGLKDIARRVAAGLAASWLFDIDTMSDDAGRLKVIEINPRPSGSLAASVAAGVPILDDLIALARGEELSDVAARDGVRVLPYTSIKVVE
ncbi:MAG: hypothetical protein FJX57_11240 [Alphaproteobacteria bacterium]|nr:hypothetical protein [Alphaproteobacteria bacterium]